jgi:hypothetical protein
VTDKASGPLVENIMHWNQCEYVWREDVLEGSANLLCWQKEKKKNKLHLNSFILSIRCSLQTMRSICLFVCLFIAMVASFRYPVAVTITGGKAANLDLCLALMTFRSEGSFTCHTYCDTTSRFIRFHLKDLSPCPTAGTLTRDARIIRSLRRRSYSCITWATHEK